MFNLLHRKIMKDNIMWDSCPTAQRWVNSIIFGVIVWILMTSSSPAVATLGLAIFSYAMFARVWYGIVCLIMHLCPPSEKEEEEGEEKEKDEGEHYLLEKKKDKDKEE